MKGFFANMRDDRDGPNRDFCYIKAVIVVADAEPVACVIVDISSGGARLAFDADHKLPNRFSLVMKPDQDLEQHYDCELRWRTTENAGVRFLP